MSRIAQYESDGMPSDELLEKIKSLDLIPLIIPEQYGGMGIKQDSVSNALALEALAYGDLSLAMSVSIPLFYLFYTDKPLRNVNLF